MKNYLAAVILGVTLMFGVGACSSQTTEPTEIVTSQEVVILDVRTPEEFSAGHLEGAQLLDLNNGEFAATVLTLDKEAEYQVYCRSGNRSSQAVEIMKKEGFTNVTDLGSLENATRITELPIETGAN